MHKTHVMYAANKDMIVIKLGGELRLFCAGLIDQAYQSLSKIRTNQPLYIDLTDAYHIDSTIYGNIAKLILMQRHDILTQIYYTHANVHRQLQALGIDQLCQINEGKPDYLKDPVDWTDITEAELCKVVDKDVLEGYVLDAHQTLAKLSYNQAIQAVVDAIKKNNH